VSGQESHVLSGEMHRQYISIERSEGIYLYDQDGRRIIDASGGPIMASLGHGLDEMADALRDQAKKCVFAFRWDFTTPILEEASAKVCEVTGGAMDKVFFVSGGSEATEIAFKLARKYHLDNGEPSRFGVISRWMGFHGFTSGALSMTGFPGRRADFIPYLRDFGHIAPAYCYRCWYNLKPETCDLECAQALEHEILCQGPQNVSAFIAEPISGMALCAACPRQDYFQKIRQICDKYGVLLILDEVMTGFGRTGKWMAYEHFGVVPDIVALGKGLGGGYFPVGAVACTARVAETIASGSGVFGVGHTWMGNPLASAVVVKAIEYLRRHNLIQRSAEMGEYLIQRLKELRSHPTVGDIRGKGLMIGLEFVKDQETKEILDPGLKYYSQVALEALKQGMFLEAGGGCERGRGGDMLMFGPPFIVTRDQIDEMVAILDKVLSVVEKRIGF